MKRVTVKFLNDAGQEVSFEADQTETNLEWSTGLMGEITAARPMVFPESRKVAEYTMEGMFFPASMAFVGTPVGGTTLSPVLRVSDHEPDDRIVYDASPEWVRWVIEAPLGFFASKSIGLKSKLVSIA